MKYKFFENVKTMEDLKEQYKKLIFKHHPDKGGKTEDMQQINAEYMELKKAVYNVHRNAQGETYKTNEEYTNNDIFKDIINKIINFNIDIEICGAWLWIYKAWNYKEELKKLGFFYCSNKKAWAFAENPKKNKHKLTLEEIRNLYGSEIVKEQEEKKILKLNRAMA